MTYFLQLAFSLVVILVAAKAAGTISTRLGQPSVLGELLAGLILGPSLLDIAHLPFMTDAHLPEFITHLGELGVLLLMFLAGLELHLTELTKTRRVAGLSGTMGVIVPVGMGWLAGLAFGLPSEQALFLGLAMGATSVSISAQTLIELKVLRSRVGLSLLGAAVFDDILVILLLSTILALGGGGGSIAGVLVVLLRMVAFLVLSVLFGLYALPWLACKVDQLQITQGAATLAIALLLVYGLAAELLGGMAAITGTFFAGLMFARTPQKSIMQKDLQALAYAFFVPIFFVNIGLSINLRNIQPQTLWLALVVIILAVVSKILGCGAGARLAGMTWIESLQLGVGMISRGEVGLIIANVGLVQGLLSQDAFSAVVGMVLATTLLTPPLLRTVFHRSTPPKDKAMVPTTTEET
jgi:Kef-type K+ transport system membrane component KefB